MLNWAYSFQLLGELISSIPRKFPPDPNMVGHGACALWSIQGPADLGQGGLFRRNRAFRFPPPPRRRSGYTPPFHQRASPHLPGRPPSHFPQSAGPGQDPPADLNAPAHGEVVMRIIDRV
jgi:hypothetical protein